MIDREMSAKEAAAVARWKPGQRWYHPTMARVVIATSRFITKTMNELEVTGRKALDAALAREGRGLLTISNHVSLFDDPILLANFVEGPYETIRWVAADAINFFGSGPKSWLFTAGKSVPIVRGAGIHQPGMEFLRDRLAEGEWVHLFPEGGRTRDEQSLMRDFHPGVGWLVEHTEPLVLPFYHHGMAGVLPVGSLRPRGGQSLRVLFGEVVDCDADWVARVDAPDGRGGVHLWSAIANSLQEKIRLLEERVNPAAIREDVASA
jgi:monolysocardiolipin acyltransferase